MPDDEPLLASMRVLDVSDGDADAVSRLLADLGADVLKIEPPCGNLPAPPADAGRRQYSVCSAEREQTKRR